MPKDISVYNPKAAEQAKEMEVPYNCDDPKTPLKAWWVAKRIPSFLEPESTNRMRHCTLFAMGATGHASQCPVADWTSRWMTTQPTVRAMPGRQI